MAFIAVMAVTEDGRIAKYAEFDTMPAARSHVTAFSQQYPDAFVVPRPAAPFNHWRLSVRNKSVEVDPPVEPEPPTRAERFEQFIARSGLSVEEFFLEFNSRNPAGGS